MAWMPISGDGPFCQLCGPEYYYCYYYGMVELAGKRVARCQRSVCPSQGLLLYQLASGNIINTLVEPASALMMDVVILSDVFTVLKAILRSSHYRTAASLLKTLMPPKMLFTSSGRLFWDYLGSPSLFLTR